jgi:SAM-dependent methyltransferase
MIRFNPCENDHSELGAECGGETMAPELERMTREESHFKVLELFRDFERGTVLDIPSGTGALAMDLKEIGFRVTCGDIDPALFKAEGIENIYADLNDVLPFENELFEYVVCVAGLHRIWNLNKPLSEFRRILKQKGYLVISFPNYSNIERRISFFFRGSLSKSVNLQSFDQHTDHQAAFFRGNLFYPQLKTLLMKNHFNVLRIDRDKTKKSSVVGLPLVALIKLARFLNSKKVKDGYSLNEMSAFNIVGGGNNIIVVCQKG